MGEKKKAYKDCPDPKASAFWAPNLLPAPSLCKSAPLFHLISLPRPLLRSLVSPRPFISTPLDSCSFGIKVDCLPFSSTAGLSFPDKQQTDFNCPTEIRHYIFPFTELLTSVIYCIVFFRGFLVYWILFSLKYELGHHNYPILFFYQFTLTTMVILLRWVRSVCMCVYIYNVWTNVPMSIKLSIA